jgi:hypothetical protein
MSGQQGIDGQYTSTYGVTSLRVGAWYERPHRVWPCLILNVPGNMKHPLQDTVGGAKRDRVEGEIATTRR